MTTNRYFTIITDSVLPIAIVLSRNNYDKFELLCKVLNLSLLASQFFLVNFFTVSKSIFFSFQTKSALLQWLRMCGQSEAPCVRNLERL